MRYIGAIDQGTTSTRFIIFNERGELVSSHQLEHKQYFPQPGWVEHDAEEIWENTKSVMSAALEKARLKPSQLAGIGITNQRESVVPVNIRTGQVVSHSIVWQDLRTSQIISRLKGKMSEEELRERTGFFKKDEGRVYMATEFEEMLEEIARERVAKARNEKIAEERAEGRRENARDAARRMIADGSIPIDKVARFSGLPLSEVEGLRRSIRL